MRILILNWRDIKNPRSGGAEILTHEMAKYWVKIGHHVTSFSSAFPGSLSLEIVDNVEIVRQGHPDARFLFSSVHFQAFLYYLKNAKKFDVVIDEIHGIPFFTPWYVKAKRIVLICEVAGDLWQKMFGPFFGAIGRLIEKFYLKVTYKNATFLTISNSTREALLKEGVRGDVTVLPMGLSFPNGINKIWNKEKKPTLIYVGRLSKSKGIEDAILALSEISKNYKEVKFWVVGSGEKEYLEYLKKMAKKNNVEEKIKFFGFVSQMKKFELMAKAHVLVAPSMKEGWGLTVPEAGRVGTPAVGYDVEGLREVILNERTGYLTSHNNSHELAQNISKMLSDRISYQRLSRTAKNLSLSYNWENTAKVALNILQK